VQDNIGRIAQARPMIQLFPACTPTDHRVVRFRVAQGQRLGDDTVTDGFNTQRPLDDALRADALVLM